MPGSKPGERRGGRKKGTPNKFTRDIKKAVLEAFDKGPEGGKGGVEWLRQQMAVNPTAFLTLLGKVLPMQVTGPDDADGNPTAIKVTLVEPD